MGQGGGQSVGEGLAWYWVTEVRVRSILEGKYIERVYWPDILVKINLIVICLQQLRDK